LKMYHQAVTDIERLIGGSLYEEKNMSQEPFKGDQQ
jgi:hypothetical protein